MLNSFLKFTTKSHTDTLYIISKIVKMESILNEYIQKLKSSGAGSANVIKKVDNKYKVESLNSLKKVTVTNELKVLLSIEYDSDLCYELDYFEPEFAWGMYLMDVEEIQSAYDEISGLNGEDDPYCPLGFLPILSDNGGNYIMINCISQSPTYGAVYDMCEGVGVNMLATNLTHFFKCLSQELTDELRTFEAPQLSECIDIKNWFDKMSEIFGNTPYFIRKGKMDTQIIDWK